MDQQVISAPPTTSTPQPSPRGWQVGIGVGLLALLSALGLVISGEVGSLLQAGLQSIPFVVLALLAYLGVDRLWARILTFVALAALVFGVFLLTLGTSIAAFIDLGALTEGGAPAFTAGAAPQLAAIAVGSGVSVLVAAVGFIPAVRRGLSRVLPLDPASFVHTIALVTIVALTLLCTIPLLVLGEPPLLAVVRSVGDQTDLTGGRGDAGMLRDTLYGLLWLIPGAIVAVGYGVRRSITEAMLRLGFVRPTLAQVGFGVGLAATLVLAVTVLGVGIDALWGTMGWPRTDEEGFSELLAFALSPIGAVVIGVTAGLGEELAVRGVLQPRLGIVLSNLFFTALHALQYNWDALLVVFLVGLVCGLVRKRTNTTTSAIVHGVYNFLLIMVTVLQVPWFS